MSKRICVLGLGYIGLPTASVLATHGFEVVGVDTNEQVVESAARGESHIQEPGLKTLLDAAVKSGNLRAVKQPEEADVFIIAVPTPITAEKRIDMRYVDAAARSIVPVLRPGNQVILESTCRPGTTRHLVAPILASAGHPVGDQVFLSYCPERVLPGRILKEIIENDRIIGGFNLESARHAEELYGAFVEGQIYLTDATTAELVKITENTFRDVNIALANELAVVCEHLGVDAWEVIELANKHPRVRMHLPGPGVGGHCVPVDPWFVVELFPAVTRLIRAAREVNERQPHFVVQLIRQMLVHIRAPKVAVLGVAYKGNVDDTRGSPAREIIRALRRQGYDVAIHDPLVARFDEPLWPLDGALVNADCAVVLVDHDEFRRWEPAAFASLMRTRQIIDTRRVLDRPRWEGAGFHLWLLGDGRSGRGRSLQPSSPGASMRSVRRSG